MYKVDSLIFDLDGTLWDSRDEIIICWSMVLDQYPEIHKVVTREELNSNLGRPLTEIARRMFPDQPEQLRQKLMAMCADYENEYLAVHGATLYPKLIETVKKLGEKITLYVVSNCQDGYIQSFYSGHDTKKYFKDFECIGRTGLSKGENIRLVMQRNNLKAPAYVGDTQGDADAAGFAQIPFIYARYGFGEVDGYDMVIDEFEDLLKLV